LPGASNRRDRRQPFFNGRCCFHHRAISRREARVASAVNHPRICVIYDDQFEGEHFIAMEFLEGATLTHMIGRWPLANFGYEQKLEGPS